MALPAPKVAVGVGAAEGEPRPEREGVLEALGEGVWRVVRDTVGVARAGATLAVWLAPAEALAALAEGAPLREGRAGAVALTDAESEAAPDGEGEPRADLETVGERVARADREPPTGLPASVGKGGSVKRGCLLPALHVGDTVPTLVARGSREAVPPASEPVALAPPVREAEVEAVEEGERRGEALSRLLAADELEGAGERDSVGAAVEEREKESSRVTDEHAEGVEDREAECVAERERAGEAEARWLRVTVPDALEEVLTDAEGDPERVSEVEREAREVRDSERDGAGEPLARAEPEPPYGTAPPSHPLSVGKGGSEKAHLLAGEAVPAPGELVPSRERVASTLRLGPMEREMSGLREGEAVEDLEADSQGEPLPLAEAARGERDPEGEPLSRGVSVPPTLLAVGKGSREPARFAGEAVGAAAAEREGAPEREAAGEGRGSTVPEASSVAVPRALLEGAPEGEPRAEREAEGHPLAAGVPVAASALAVAAAEAEIEPDAEGARDGVAGMVRVPLAAAEGVPP